jgi:hypothetical protein
MAKQTFTTGQVLNAAQMTSLQQTAMGGGSTTAKTASYTLVAADAGTVVQMNSASATTITVNTALFAAGDTVQIQNIGAGVCTVTAGTATVNTAGSLALSQWEGGQLYFTATGASIFFDTVQTNKVIQVVFGSTATAASNTTTTYADTNLTATITPTSASSQILILVSQNGVLGTTASNGVKLRILRGATSISDFAGSLGYSQASSTRNDTAGSCSFLDSPATTSATTYKTQFAQRTADATACQVQVTSESKSTITLMEIGA